MLAENEQAYNAFQQDEVPHEAKLSHELVGGAAAFYAMRKCALPRASALFVAIQGSLLFESKTACDAYQNLARILCSLPGLTALRLAGMRSTWPTRGKRWA